MAFCGRFQSFIPSNGKHGTQTRADETCVKALLSGKYVMAVQPTSFGKTIICESVVFGVTKIKRLLIVVFIPDCSITEDQISMVGCLREEREFVKGNYFKQVLGHYFCRTSSVF